MKTMACDIVGNTLITVHTSGPPSQEEWDLFVNMAASMLDRIGPSLSRNLVVTQGGGPSFSQRQQINAVLRGRTPPAAVVSANAFVRTIVAALAVFNPKIKVFPPDRADDAIRYLGLSDAEGKAAWRTVVKLQAELGITSSRRG